MKTAHRFVSLALMCSASTTPAWAQHDPARAADRCEEAVSQTIRGIRGADAQEMQFIGAKRFMSPLKGGHEIDVKGEGRYRSARGGAADFSYSCVFDTKTGATSGVMFRETGSTVAGVNTGTAWQPDLTRFSPDNCESATAAALKAKYPRVGRIVFDAEGRQLRAAPNASTMFEGRGAVERAEGMNAVPFRFSCEFETRTGRVLSATTTE